jgi:hypothetical protein
MAEKTTEMMFHVIIKYSDIDGLNQECDRVEEILSKEGYEGRANRPVIEEEK